MFRVSRGGKHGHVQLSSNFGRSYEHRSHAEEARADEHALAQCGADVDPRLVSLWGWSASVSDKDSKARAERLAIFVGPWPPTFILLGKVLQDLEATPEEQTEQARMKAVA